MGFLKKFENHLVAPKADLNLQLDANYAALGEAMPETALVCPNCGARRTVQ